ncbi:hypothetical protein J4D99_06280 [Siccationidurans ginsengisoli]|uniref:hypothetical protein n=1 Tax=Hymenobacter TaxID=89966 RepID=UPI001AADA470|nr:MULTISPECIES: hypothetical protein [unclassified Hymenobacter]MBO2030990.1 hypothetical protein [Hymenobacter sp. BT559]
MDHLYRLIAQHWHLTQAQYTQLHLVTSVLLGPLLGVLLVIFLLLRRRKSEASTTE